MQNKLFSVKNKKILITGASSGLGRHFACILAKAGATVIACGRREHLLKELESEVKAEGGNIIPLPLDIVKFEESQTKLNELMKNLDGIDVLINNAGYSHKVKKILFESTLEDWDEIMNINLKAVWNCSNIVAKDMVTRNISGSIINISSTVANRTRLGNPMYGISKAAVSSLTQKLSLEYSKFKIRVNAIAPGFFETEMNQNFIQSPIGIDTIKRTIPLSRVGQPFELDGVIFLLASNASSYMTGECIFIDGGYVTNSIT